jgi:hypothetical protein
MIDYFFSGKHYIQVTRGETGPGTVNTPTPKPISDWGWPKFSKTGVQFGRDGIDAALYSGSKCYFFKGTYYVRVTRHGTTGFGTQDFTEPHPISEWGWRFGFGVNGIDAALWSGPVTYFFSGNHYLRVTRGQSDFGNGGDGTALKTIAEGWGWPAPFSNGVKGALPSGLKCYFFSGKEYIRVSRGFELAGFIDPTYPLNITNWKWPAGFAENGVDAALYSGGDLEPEPVGGLISNVNYWMGSGGTNLTGVSATINIDNDMISTTDGFSFQLNAISQYIPGTSKALIQQFVIYSDANTNDLYARLFFYAGSATAPVTFTVSLDVEKPLGTLPGINHIKAGSSVSFAIQTAPTGIVSGCKFAYSPVGGSPTTVLIDISDGNLTLADISPIDIVTMNIVADYSTPGHNGVANFSEAQGTISYSANQPLYASTTVPSFSNVSGITVETVNIIYAALPANRPVDASQLFGTTPTVPVDLEDVSKPKISISHSLTPSRRVLVPDKPLEHSLALPQPPHSRST